MKSLLLLVVALNSAAQTFSYPITPRPLRKLVIESQFIVQGKVIELGSNQPTKRDTWYPDYALVAVNDKFKGSEVPNIIKVYYHSGMICPAPPHFVKDLEVIVFLDRREKSLDGFEVHALSYGLKNFSDKEGIAVLWSASYF